MHPLSGWDSARPGKEKRRATSRSNFCKAAQPAPPLEALAWPFPRVVAAEVVVAAETVALNSEPLAILACAKLFEIMDGAAQCPIGLVPGILDRSTTLYLVNQSANPLIPPTPHSTSSPLWMDCSICPDVVNRLLFCLQ